jgi:hypothetical protein
MFADENMILMAMQITTQTLLVTFDTSKKHLSFSFLVKIVFHLFNVTQQSDQCHKKSTQIDWITFTLHLDEKKGTCKARFFKYFP